MPSDRLMLESSQPTILHTDAEAWSTYAAEAIGSAIRSILKQRQTCSLMLTGGRSAARVYTEWASSINFPTKGTHLFFGDERCVGPDHSASNYRLAVRTLFPHGLPRETIINRMEGERSDLEAAARDYEACLPRAIDILLLGLGSDGHIASLFPGSQVFSETDRLVVPVTGSTSPHDRLTITPSVVTNAHRIFLLAPGKEKGQVLAEALRAPADIRSFPVRLTLRGTWLLDTEAVCQLETV